ncbi:hypothetical protein [Algoriphagus sp.]|uniref:hypothetical protein n=1 Tax=Algoriphagus sp. TaxID=1872435 RepID=UPI0032799F07
MKSIITTFCVLAIICTNQLSAQSSMHANDQAKRDSLKQTPYSYSLPFFGDKIQSMGYEQPLPYGLMINYVHQVTRLEITRLSVGLGPFEPVDMGFVKFDPVTNTANVFNFRADAWVFPFLNIYGIYAHSEGSANIDITFPVNLNIQTSPTVDTYGGGIVLAYGRNSYFGAFNLNLSSSNTSALDEPVFGRVTSLRVGKTLNLKKPEHKISLSVGVQNQYVERVSAGELTFNDIFESLDEEKLQQMKDDISSAANNWYDDLSLAQKLVVDALVEGMEDYLDGEGVGNTRIQYEFEKEVISPWSLQLGVQLMFNKKFWYRVEYGHGKGRDQLLLSVNYRFGI